MNPIDKIFGITNMKKTSISLEKHTRDKLASFGKKGSTFDQIIAELIEKVETKDE